MCLQVVSPAFAHEAVSERTTSLVEKYENVVSVLRVHHIIICMIKTATFGLSKTTTRMLPQHIHMTTLAD